VKPLPAIGETFTVGRGRELRLFVREADDPTAPPSERIRVRHLASEGVRFESYSFGTEPEWFRQRGFTVP
jgi:hypothetical protein